MDDYNNRRQAVVDNQICVMKGQNEEINCKNEELRALKEAHEHELAMMASLLEGSEQALSKMKNSLALTEGAPRLVIHTHPDYKSVVDSQKHLTPSKRIRTDADTEKLDSKVDQISLSSSSLSINSTINTIEEISEEKSSE